jgi:1,4-dihydroxy-2-naphthoyl-CoA hydrolase
VQNPIPASRFDVLIGTEWLEIGPEEARARIAVSDDHKQPYGLVHGGVYSALADSICSRATAEAVRAEGKLSLALSNHATFLRPITDGHVNALARRRHGGRMTWVWDVELSDDHGRLCALIRMTIAVRERDG